jgi:hypothetical protein
MYNFSEKVSSSKPRVSEDAAGVKSVVDNRPESSVQRKLIQLGSLSQRKINPDVSQLASPEEELPAQGKFDNPTQLKITQLASPEEELPAQGKFENSTQLKTAQLASPEEELPAQGKFENTTQLKTTQLASPEEELPAQGKFENPTQLKTAQLASPEEELPAQGKFENTLAQREAKPNNTGMPDNLKSGVEMLSGVSLDHVKVHYASDKPAQLNALAYAQGSDIHVAPGQEKHLPHEAWHVVQQMQGRVEPTTQVSDVAVNDNPSLETEADVMGEKAMRI